MRAPMQSSCILLIADIKRKPSHLSFTDIIEATRRAKCLMKHIKNDALYLFGAAEYVSPPMVMSTADKDTTYDVIFVIHLRRTRW